MGKEKLPAEVNEPNDLEVEQDAGVETAPASDDVQIEQSEAEPHETVEESVKKAIEELKAQEAEDKPEQGAKDGEPGPGDAKDKPDKQNANQKVKGEENEEDEFDPELSPPERLKPHEAKIFNNLPKTLKRAFHRSMREMQGQMTQVTQAASAGMKIQEVTRPYHESWKRSGLSPVQAVGQLVQAQARLVDPSTKKVAFLELGDDLGFDIEMLADAIDYDPDDDGDFETTPQTNGVNNQLQNRINHLESMLVQLKAEPIKNDIVSVINERDAGGNLVYPNYQNPAFLKAAEPLVRDYVRTSPGLSYGQAYKKAYNALMGRPEDSQVSTQTKLPEKSNNNVNGAAVSAARTVRGSVAGNTTPTQPQITLAQQGESVEESVRAALDELKRGLI